MNVDENPGNGECARGYGVLGGARGPMEGVRSRCHSNCGVLEILEIRIQAPVASYMADKNGGKDEEI